MFEANFTSNGDWIYVFLCLVFVGSILGAEWLANRNSKKLFQESQEGKEPELSESFIDSIYYKQYVDQENEYFDCIERLEYLTNKHTIACNNRDIVNINRFKFELDENDKQMESIILVQDRLKKLHELDEHINKMSK